MVNASWRTPCAFAGLAGAPGPDRSDQAGPVLAGDLLFQCDGQVTTIDEVFLRYRIPIVRIGRDAGQGRVLAMTGRSGFRDP